MNILLVGNGGREHAIALQLSHSPHVERIYVAPGNGGTATLAKSSNVPIGAEDIPALLTFAGQQAIDFTVVAPEAPLVAGIVDAFQSAGRRIFGPTQAAAQLEGSKAFSKAFMLRHGIPTGHAEIFSDFDDAMRYLRNIDSVPVVKANGLAAGKGVLLPPTVEAVAGAVRGMLMDGHFGSAGATVLLEEKLSGPEVSVLAFCDGTHAVLLPTVQEHKRLLNDDRGPNTDGMGAFSPSPLVSPQLLADIDRTIVRPALTGMAAEGTPYVGILYADIILTPTGPRVLEFNCSFGDPGTQVLLPLLQSDLLELLVACVDGTLAQVKPRWRKDAAVTVVMASEGYPQEYRTGLEIFGVDAAEAAGCTVFQAGTRWKGERLLTSGGRVLAVTALGRSVGQAAHHAYAGVERIRFAGAHCRRDIGLPRGERNRTAPQTDHSRR